MIRSIAIYALMMISIPLYSDTTKITCIINSLHEFSFKKVFNKKDSVKADSLGELNVSDTKTIKLSPRQVKRQLNPTEKYIGNNNLSKTSPIELKPRQAKAVSAQLTPTAKYAPSNSFPRINPTEVSPSQIAPNKLKFSELSPSHLSYSPLKTLFERTIDPTETILKESKMIKSRPLSGGANTTYVVTFENGTQAVWKPHIEKWYSNYRAEVLAYELDQVLGFNIVPITVERKIAGQKGSLQLFLESGPKSNLKENELAKQSLFDHITNNRDRHRNNFLASPSGEVISIDNGLSFTGHGANPKFFFRRRKEIRRFMKTDEGTKIMNHISTVDLKKLETEVSKYIGSEDAVKLIRRIKIVLREFRNLK